MSHALHAPACAIFDLFDVHVLTVERHRSSFTLIVGTVPSLVGCPFCGVLAAGHGRVVVLLLDLPCARVPVRVFWRQCRYRCHWMACEGKTFSQVHEMAAPRTMLTTSAIIFLGGGDPAARLRHRGLGPNRDVRGRLEHRLGRPHSGHRGPAGRQGPVGRGSTPWAWMSTSGDTCASQGLC